MRLGAGLVSNTELHVEIGEKKARVARFGAFQGDSMGHVSHFWRFNFFVFDSSIGLQVNGDHEVAGRLCFKHGVSR